MGLSLRAKLFAMAGSTALAFLVVLVASAILSARTAAQLATIEAQHIPRLEIGPQLEADFSALKRGFQDAVAARETESLDRTREIRDRLFARLDRGRDLLGPTDTAELQSAIAEYYDAAFDISRRMIGKESGEDLVEAMGLMQRKQASAQAVLDRVATPDAHGLGEAFSATRSLQVIATRIRIGVTITCLLLLLALSVWVGRGIVRSLDVLQAGFERYGRGAFDEAIPTAAGADFASLAAAANRMAERLSRLVAERERAQWVGDGLVGLGEAVAGELEEAELATRVTRYLARYVGAPAAALYRASEGRILRLLGHHAATPEGLAETFRFGEGLVGEAAMGRALIVFDQVPADFFRVRSALGDSPPRKLVLVPLLRNADVTGVLELALFADAPPSAEELLTKAGEIVGVALEVARARAGMRMLLATTQEQANTLSAQEEALRVTNEELQSQQEELRQTNEELAQQAEELEVQRAALEERNTSLSAARTRLEKQTEELKLVSSYKSQFLANMSHELRTPLNSMLLLSNLLAENPEKSLTEKQIEYAKTIHSAGRDLLGLINQVLDLAKVEAGKQEVKLANVAIGEIATRVRRVFAPLAKDRGLAFGVVVDEEMPEAIRTDEGLVMQILNNLLGNAIKFTDHGEVSLRIGAPRGDRRIEREDLRHDQAIAFAISDTGPGIAPADRQRIFEPFEQLDATAGRRHGGTGLGLNIARELANLLGGELQVDSVLGKGSTFSLVLPKALSGTVTAAPRSEASERRVARSPSSLPPNILIIEDDPVMTDVVRDVVRERGIGCLSAADGATGLRLARERQPQGIILDVKLPDIDGWQVMERLRADAATANIPVHFVSALDMPARAMALGAMGYLTKPATRADIARVVESLAPARRRTSARILVVEDDVAAANSVLQQLHEEGLDAMRVTTAREALALTERERFGCIILDLSLPDMSGLALLEQLQARENTEMPAVVVYTGRALNKAETAKLESYADAVVLKDGSSTERLIDEIRLFVRRLEGGGGAKRTMVPRLSSQFRLEGRKILVVDDDMRTVYALSAALRAKGAEVLAAENGAVALEVLGHRSDVDAILMDIMMPEMDGYEATRRIRQQPAFKDVPIVALTAKAMKGEDRKCVEAGATAYMSKPIDIDRLLELLHTHLARAAP